MLVQWHRYRVVNVLPGGGAVGGEPSKKKIYYFYLSDDESWFHYLSSIKHFSSLSQNFMNHMLYEHNTIVLLIMYFSYYYWEMKLLEIFNDYLEFHLRKRKRYDWFEFFFFKPPRYKLMMFRNASFQMWWFIKTS